MALLTGVGIAGPYTWTFDSQALGIMEDAPELEHTPSAQLFGGDNLGDTPQDGVYRGGNMFVNVVLQQYNAAAARRAFAPWASDSDPGVHGQSGQLISDWMYELKGTIVAGTTGTPSPVVFNKATLAPGFPVRTLWGSRLRQVPIRFQIFPYEDASSVVRWYQNVS